MVKLRKGIIITCLLLAVCVYFISKLTLFLIPIFRNDVDVDSLLKDLDADVLARQKATHKDIPKHIHQIFFFITDSVLPERLKRAQTTWKTLNPKYDYTLWNSTMVDNLIERQYPWLMNLYKSYSHWVSRADVARYVIIRHFGGIYVDIDIICKRPLDELLIRLQTKTLLLRQTTPKGLSNDFIISVPKHDFWTFLLGGLHEANLWYFIPYVTIMFSTGPQFIWAKYRQYPWKNDIFVLQDNSSYIQQTHGSAWHSVDGVLIYYFFKHTVLSISVIASVILAVLIVYFLIKGRLRRKLRALRYAM